MHVSVGFARSGALKGPGVFFQHHADFVGSPWISEGCHQFHGIVTAICFTSNFPHLWNTTFSVLKIWDSSPQAGQGATCKIYLLAVFSTRRLLNSLLYGFGHMGGQDWSSNGAKNVNQVFFVRLDMFQIAWAHEKALNCTAGS